MINYAMNHNPFKIEDDAFDPDYFGKSEVIMALGNGYLGVRSTHEENYPAQIRNTFINGTFNKSTPFEVTELPNFPDVIQLGVKINGNVVDLMRVPYQDYAKRLHLDQAMLERTFTLLLNDDTFTFTFQRFVSWKDLNVIASRLSIVSSSDAEIEIMTSIDGTQTNSGAMHFLDGQLSILHDNVIQYETQTTESHIDVSVRLQSSSNQPTKKTQKHTHRRKAQISHFFDLSSQQPLVFDRVAVYQTSRDVESFPEEYYHALLNQSYEALLESHLTSVSDYWAEQKITLDSDLAFDQVAVLFAQYHLRIMTPYHDHRLGIGAKGLSGEGYKGHSFWDTEIFIFPYFLYTQPNVAKNLLTFRYLGLEKAKEKARKNGFSGAQYPWEMAWYTDGEVTPEWGAIDVKTGRQTKIWSGFIEQHITGDIIYALIRYLEVTKDIDFLKKAGLEMIFETAIFWATRAEYNDSKGVYEINDVIGADEYKEHINNNAFTNYMAHFNLKTAIQYYDRYKKENWAQVIIKKTEWLDFFQKVIDVEQKIYLPTPNENGLIPQDDTYLTLPTLDIKNYKSNPQVGTIFHDYSLSQINHMQVSKQADVLMLWHLFPELFSNDTLMTNFDYYESKTLHDSSLSLSTHAILANQVNQESLAIELFEKASAIDLGPNMKSSDHGIHAASIGGIWQIIFFGFCGIRLIHDQLTIQPKLPSRIKTITLPLVIAGQKRWIEIKEASVIIWDEKQTIKHSFSYKKHETIQISQSNL